MRGIDGRRVGLDGQKEGGLGWTDMGWMDLDWMDRWIEGRRVGLDSCKLGWTDKRKEGCDGQK